MSSTKEEAIALLKDTPYFYDASDKLLEALSGTLFGSLWTLNLLLLGTTRSLSYVHILLLLVFFFYWCNNQQASSFPSKPNKGRFLSTRANR